MPDNQTSSKQFQHLQKLYTHGNISLPAAATVEFGELMENAKNKSNNEALFLDIVQPAYQPKSFFSLTAI